MYRIRDLESYFPQVYLNEYVKEVLRCCQIEVETFFYSLSESEKEYTVSSATYSLPWWCNLVGVDYNESLDLDIMRGNILATMKFRSTTTIDVLKKIVESYTNGTCEIIENYSNYSFVIKFISTIGIPSNINEIKKFIDKIKPAHLNYSFEFRYRTWDDIKKLGRTWDDIKALNKTWDNLREGVI